MLPTKLTSTLFSILLLLLISGEQLSAQIYEPNPENPDPSECLFRFGKRTAYGLINQDGKTIVPKIYSQIALPLNGMIAVSRTIDRRTNMTVYNLEGEVIFPEFQGKYEVYESGFVMKNKSGGNTLYTKDGKELYSCANCNVSFQESTKQLLITQHNDDFSESRIELQKLNGEVLYSTDGLLLYQLTNIIGYDPSGVHEQEIMLPYYVFESSGLGRYNFALIDTTGKVLYESLKFFEYMIDNKLVIQSKQSVFITDPVSSKKTPKVTEVYALLDNHLSEIIPFSANCTRLWEAYDHNESYSFRSVDELYGLYNKSGSLTIPARHKTSAWNIGPLIAEYYKEDKFEFPNGDYNEEPFYFLFNSEGDTLLDFNSQYKDHYLIPGTSTMLYRVIGKDGLYGYKDDKWNTVIPFEYDFLSEPSGGSIIYHKGNQSGLISTDGSLIIELDKPILSNLHDGLFVAGEYYLPSAEKIEKLASCFIHPISHEGINKGVVYSQYDQSGVKTSTIPYDRVLPVRDGVWTFELDCKVTTLNKQISDRLREDQLDLTTSFHQGYAVVKNKELKEGLIDSTGKIVVPCIYDALYTKESQEVAIISVYDKMGKNYGTAQQVILPTIINNNIIAIKNGKAGLISTSNKVIIPFEFERFSVDDQMEYYIFFKTGDSGNGYCLFSLDGKILGNGLYEDVDTTHKSDWIRVVKQGIVGYIHIDGKEVWPK